MKKRISLVFSLLSIITVLLFATSQKKNKASAGEDTNKTLDFIFNNQTLGETTITIKRSEWEKLCDNYRFFYKNENSVHAESYVYKKDGKTWTMKDVGLRLRGNTSRYVPQGTDNGRKQEQKNASWNPEYYNYAEKPNDDYRQSHFKISFGEFSDEKDKSNKFLAGCLKGIPLKRLDQSCGREIFCYDLFRKNGIWTAPRASHTRVTINIIENKKDNSVTKLNFGVYEMFEEINKQSLKSRTQKETNNKNAWKNNKGNLWKCGFYDLPNVKNRDAPALTDSSGEGMGVEEVKIVFNTNGKPESKIWKHYPLDLKTNKKEFDAAKNEFCSFIKELNTLPVPSDDSDKKAINEIKAFYEKWFDVDFFIKTYAINIICGMDDDYWNNTNNYYLYFDTGSEDATNKLYFIPFDYDNTLGCSISEPGFKQNPLEWGRGQNRPLIDRLLSVPEYKEKFKNYLLDLTSEKSLWNYKRCSGIFNNWKKMLSPYLNSPDLNFTGLGVQSFEDYTWRPGGYSVINKENNIYDATRESIKKWFTGNYLQIKQIKDESHSGIKIEIKNIPSDAVTRHIFLNDKLVNEISPDRKDGKAVASPKILNTEFVYPYTTDGKAYKLKVVYLNRWYGVSESAEINVTASGGQGEFYLKNKPSYKITNGVLKFNQLPVIQIGSDKPSAENNREKYYVIEIQSVGWQYQSWNYLGFSPDNFDFNGKKEDGTDIVSAKNDTLMFNLYYVVSNDTYGNYRLVIYEYEETKGFKIN